MKAVVLEKPDVLVYKDVDTPQPGSGEALLKVKAVSICGSDILRVYHGAAKTYPLILGHECAGEVTAVGDGVDEAWLGRQACVVPLIPCMNCTACRRQIYSACRRYSFIGSRVSGGFAEYLKLPASSLIPLPDQVDCEVGALIEPASVALYSLERGGVKPGQRIAILGVGSIGLFTVQWARAKEAGHIIAMDVVDERLEAAKSMGAHTTLNPAQADVVTEVRELTGDGVDIALEVAGSPQALEQAILMTRPRGRIVCVGNQPEEATLPLKLIEHIMRQELDVRGVWMSYTAPFPGHAWPDTIAAAQAGHLELDKMISHRFPLSAAPDVFRQIQNRSLSYRKIIISPES